MKRLFTIFLLLIPAACFGQGQQIIAGPFPNSGLLYVCPVPSGGTPCPSPVSIFSNIGLTTGISNPIVVFAQQTYTFYAAGGQYTLEMPASGIQQVVGGGSGGSGGLCGGVTACIDVTQAPYSVKAKVKRASDGTWTAGSNPTTVTSASGLFVAGDFPASFRGISGGLGMCSTANGTATFVNSTTISVTCPSGNGVGSPSGTASIAWGPDDSSGITAATTAALALCASYHTVTIQFPPGVTFINQGQAGVIPAGCTSTIGGGFAGGSTGLSVIGGSGDSRTALVFLPETGFNFSTGGAGGCFWDGAAGGSAGTYKAGFTIDGMGETLAGVNPSPCTTMFSSANAGGNKHIGLLSWGTSASPLSTAYSATNQQAGPNIDIQIIGFFNSSVQMGNGEWHAGFIGTGGNCTSTTFDYGMWWGGGDPASASVMALQNGCSYHGFAPVMQGIGASSAGINIAGATAQVYIDGMTMPSSVPTSSPMIDFTAAGTLTYKNSQLLGGTTAGACTGSVGTFINGGGNTYLGGPWLCTNTYVDLTGTFSGASCTGTATASQTLGLYGTGPNVTATTCTSTTIGSGIRMPKAGTVLALIAKATTGGVNASSGVVTVLKNGSAQTMTCTFGTTTACNDGAVAHQVTVAQGDLISLQFTTQAAETLAGVSVSLVIW